MTLSVGMVGISDPQSNRSAAKGEDRTVFGCGVVDATAEQWAGHLNSQRRTEAPGRVYSYTVSNHQTSVSHL